MSPLPPPQKDQAYVNVSALRGGMIEAPLEWIIDTAQPGERLNLPALPFLLQHSKTGDTFLFDLGIRKDWQKFGPNVIGLVEKLQFDIVVEQDVVDSLAAGGLSADDVKHVCLSHLHLDHVGDPALFKQSTFVVGAGSREVLANGFPQNPHAPLPSDLLPLVRTRFLDLSTAPPLGPFEHALDFYGDGSVYIVDAGTGHVAGHVNLLARTSPDGAWVFLAGDSAHDRRLLYGEAKIPCHNIFGCAHLDPEKSAEHIAHIRELMEGEPRVQVIIAHDRPWFDENEKKDVWFPGGKLPPL
ncbi:metallo-hydrolase/oxidoreductase [Phanerochaete sordida]|uniref:Metallo-hydrolase/oxidoreductase n=1 Tax=Phanerochaete sordida TaxID=48140 RepID=A0A9P3LFP9_9APHY|nr:metallo-hydrolase/oxidoreductase [Phanerochaete sordida]